MRDMQMGTFPCVLTCLARSDADACIHTDAAMLMHAYAWMQPCHAYLLQGITCLPSWTYELYHIYIY